MASGRSRQPNDPSIMASVEAALSAVAHDRTSSPGCGTGATSWP